MASFSSARLRRPAGVLAFRSSIAARICSSVWSGEMPSAVKNPPNSRLDRLARVTICSATGARSTVYVSSSSGPAWPRSTAASFQARL